ncbi:AAA family ATPase [Flavobacterium sp. ZT3R17]|uniref:AAA family ATPase n=1 Tax=Flavobacterium cryoconiti TaxID=3398736 RepID=UPI003A8BF6AE
MKTVILKSLTLINFKGIRNLTINFLDGSTNIYGDNGTGKTTIFDAFEWIRSGKDSSDRTNFEIKTLDANNVAIPQIEHEVSAEWLVNGDVISMRRVLLEKWTKKKGSEVAEFTGNETKYYWNLVPMQQKEFNDLVSGILDESVFKLITNPLAFNNDKVLSVEKRRNILTTIAGDTPFEVLAGDNPEYLDLLSNLTQGKTLDQYEKQISASIAKAKVDLKAIPTRVDEINRSKPIAYDFPTLNTLLGVKQDELTKVEGLITNKSSAFDHILTENRTTQLALSNIISEIEVIEAAAKRESLNAVEKLKPDTSILDGIKASLKSFQDELASSEGTLKTIKGNIDSKGLEISALVVKMDSKRTEWTEENAKEISFEEDSFHCPTCKRDFEAGDFEAKKVEMRQNFMTKKAENLKLIQAQGLGFKTEKENIEAEVNVLKTRSEAGEKHIGTLKETIKTTELEIEKLDVPAVVSLEIIDPEETARIALSLNQGCQDKKAEKLRLEGLIKTIPEVDVKALESEKQTLKEDIDLIKVKLNNEVQINAIESRIQALRDEEKALASQISAVEKTQFAIDRFNKLRITTIEEKVNAKFKFVKFKLFELQVNGGESPCCKALFNGVPFSDLNTASTINAGLDIINTLCDYYQVSAPIFVDNRESVVNVIPIKSQMINLFVCEGSELSVGKPKFTREHLAKVADAQASWEAENKEVQPAF